MTRSPAKPRPVPVGRYRYSKLRWRLLVHALDAVGTILAAIVRRFRPSPAAGRSAADPGRPARPPRRRGAEHAAARRAAGRLSRPRRSTCSPRRATTRSSRPTRTSTASGSPSAPGSSGGRTAGPCSRRSGAWAGRSAAMRYDLGIDVRGDVLSVLVLALAGVRRRVGWAMGGGGVPADRRRRLDPRPARGRARGWPCSNGSGSPPDPSARVDVHVADEDRVVVARRLAEAWPRRAVLRVGPRSTRGPGGPAAAPNRGRRPQGQPPRRKRWPTSPTGSTPIGSRRRPPLLAVHLGRGQRGEALADPLVEGPGRAVPRGRLAGRGRRGRGRPGAFPGLPAARPPPRLDRQPDRHPDDRPAGTGRPVHRRRLRPGAPGGLGRDALGRPLQRDEPSRGSGGPGRGTR